jgi:hypothetical protein
MNLGYAVLAMIDRFARFFTIDRASAMPPQFTPVLNQNLSSSLLNNTASSSMHVLHVNHHHHRALFKFSKKKKKTKREEKFAKQLLPYRSSALLYLPCSGHVFEGRGQFFKKFPFRVLISYSYYSGVAVRGVVQACISRRLCAVLIVDYFQSRRRCAAAAEREHSKELFGEGKSILGGLDRVVS